MTVLPLPANLVADVATDANPRRHDWMAALPDTVRDLAERWDLILGEPFQPGGRSAWVAPVRDRAGRDLVLKVGWAHPEGAHEADGLRRWAGDGTVILYESYVSGPTAALLLERCVPGTRLLDAVAEPDQDHVIAGLLTRLWRAPTEGPSGPAGPFRSLAAMCAQWADEFDEELAAAPSHPLDPGLVRVGMRLFRDLPATADREVLLCTDLHAENVLAARREPWLVIDPKPHVGDPTYDPLQHLLNCPDRLARDPVGLARRMAGLLDLDAERLLRWLFARAVQESIDNPWLCPVAERLRAEV